jgi:sigma-B regulation protein RsbU (phosphoserine phosphatase)
VLEGLARELDMAAIYELVGDKVRETYREADLTIAVYDSETDLLSAPYLFESGRRVAFAPFKVAGRGFIGHLLQDPHTLLINENMEQAVARYGGIDVTGVGLPKSALYVPLTMGRSMRGEIVLADMQKEHAFSQSDVRVLETLAHSVSVALETARLREQEKKYLAALEHEFEIGREIQAGFLPDILPQPEGWEIAASLLPAREVAGDFYDVFELPDEKIGLVIADVCDKGLGAALFMTLVRSFVRAASNMDFYARAGSGNLSSSADRLKSAISLTNNYIAETHSDTGMFATVFFGILNPHTGVLTYINGGHLPPMLISRHGAEEVLKRTGPAVGAALDADYGIMEVVMGHGDTLFAYTDGLTDTANSAGEYYSEKGLIPLLASDQTLSSLLVDIQKQIADYATGAQQYDDITMLAVRHLK